MIFQLPRFTHLVHLVAAGAVAAIPTAASGEGSTAAGSATAQVVAPITLAREADLEFGTIAVTNHMPGSVTIGPFGSATSYAGGASGICAEACPAPHAARFTVSGEPGRSYRVSVPASLAIVPAGSDGEPGVTVDSLVVSVASNLLDSGGVLSPSGEDRFEVGGTLHLPAQAAPGRYTAQVPVIVAYP